MKNIKEVVFWVLMDIDYTDIPREAQNFGYIWVMYMLVLLYHVDLFYG